MDLDAKGVGICISIMKCTPGKKECGAGASCCMGPDTTFIGVCMPNVCLLDSCTPE